MLRHLTLPTLLRRCLSTSAPAWAKQLPPRIVIPESDITESFLKGSGPGGQKINKTSSAVQLTHVPTGIVIKCQQTRSRQINREIARRTLQERLEERLLGDQSRTAIKAKEENRKRASKLKKSRRKYKKLEEEKTVEAGGTPGKEENEEVAHEGRDSINTR